MVPFSLQACIEANNIDLVSSSYCKLIFFQLFHGPKLKQ